MATKTKGSFLPTLIGVALVATLGYIVVVIYGQQPDGKGNGDRQCTYLLTVTFNPTPQTPAVYVTYAVVGGRTKDEAPETSPWQQPFLARCGSIVILNARVDRKYIITKNGSNMLNCKIQHGDESYSDSALPGELSAHCVTGG